jgi:FMN phosphatase YigB (HAD superfamily)
MHHDDLADRIDAVIFDLGGVIINIDPSRTYNAFAELAAKPLAEVKANFDHLQVFERYESGQLDDEAFLALLTEAVGKPIERQQLIEAWNALLLEIPARKLHVINELSSKYRIFLLSNTNSIHFREVEQILNRQHGIRDFKQLMEGVILSYEVKMRKPELQIYGHLARTFKLEPSRSLFIDDSLPNVEGAKSVGFEAIHYDTSVGLYDLMGYEF